MRSGGDGSGGGSSENDSHERSALVVYFMGSFVCSSVYLLMLLFWVQTVTHHGGIPIGCGQAEFDRSNDSKKTGYFGLWIAHQKSFSKCTVKRCCFSVTSCALDLLLSFGFTCFCELH